MRGWEDHWLRHAALAADMSTCLSRHVGAVAVLDKRLVATGFNGNAPGALHCTDGGCERCQNRAFSGASLETCTCVHAEANVVAYAARYGARLSGATVYSTHRPCLTCALLVASAGVIEVVYAEHYPGLYPVPPTLTIRQQVYEADEPYTPAGRH